MAFQWGSSKPPEEARFWAKVKKSESCWLWQGAISTGGYGASNRNGKYILAHRHSLLLDGQKLSPSLVVDHICRNRSCVRPDHLRQITRNKNSSENSLGPPALNIKKSHCPYGHEYDRINNRNERCCSICMRKSSNKWKDKNK